MLHLAREMGIVRGCRRGIGAKERGKRWLPLSQYRNQSAGHKWERHDFWVRVSGSGFLYCSSRSRSRCHYLCLCLPSLPPCTLKSETPRIVFGHKRIACDTWGPSLVPSSSGAAWGCLRLLPILFVLMTLPINRNIHRNHKYFALTFYMHLYF